MAASNIRDVFGLDYLLTQNQPRTGSLESATQQTAAPGATAPSLIEQAKNAKRIMQMSELLKRLAAGNGTGKLYDLLDQIQGVELPALLSSAADLESAEMIRVIDRNRHGNWDISITDQGRQFLAATNA